MRDGVIEQLGAPREIYEKPATEFVATFLGASNLIEAPSPKRCRDVAGRTPSGALWSATASDGCEVELAIRPERVRMTRLRDAPGVIDAASEMRLSRDGASVPRERRRALLAFAQNSATRDRLADEKSRRRADARRSSSYSVIGHEGEVACPAVGRHGRW